MPLLLALTACETELQSCDTMAYASLQIDLTDPEGAPVEAANVQFSVDGGSLQDCYATEGTYTCGWETVGEFVVHIQADGLEPVEETFTVEAHDVCHVDTQFAEIQLERACTAEEVAAIHVTVDESGGGAGDAPLQVFWEHADGDSEPQECFFDIEFLCAYGESGDLRVFAFNDTGGSAEAEVTVEHDGCHPIPEDVHLVLAYEDEPAG